MKWSKCKIHQAQAIVLHRILARQFYAILAYGPPEELKMKTVEVLEHTVKSPIYEDWINVQAMNIYDSGKAFILLMVH
ncbi:hypothetical protein CRE_08366 [Caenorhabditis remanei]|uniref:Uncharacterized protein n=1 Tax=Caenorhabditis remanei TaxID=31234 RepID=E3MPD3_CAERE|nr:hypothetical protein CRE_08366 [Caenorhabditis remanei]